MIMGSKERFMAAFKREKVDRPPVANATSIVTLEPMECTGCYLPEAHLSVKKMVRLAKAGYDVLSYDTIAPVFSIVHEAEALGCTVDWGRKDLMPEVKGELCKEPEKIKIPLTF